MGEVLRKRLFGLSLILTILELVSLSCSTPPRKTEKPLLEPAKQLRVEQPEKKPAPEKLKEVTLEDALNDASVRQAHLNQMDLPEHVSKIIYFDTLDSEKTFWQEVKNLYNPTREEAVKLRDFITGTSYRVLAIVPSQLVGTKKKSIVLVFPKFYRSVQNQDHAEILIEDQMRKRAEINANGFVFDDAVYVPGISSVTEAPRRKKLIKINTGLFYKMQDLMATYAMIEAVKQERRLLPKHIRIGILEQYIEQYMSLKLTAEHRFKAQGKADGITHFIGRNLFSLRWYPDIDFRNKTASLAERK